MLGTFADQFVKRRSCYLVNMLVLLMIVLAPINGLEIIVTNKDVRQIVAVCFKLGHKSKQVLHSATQRNVRCVPFVAFSQAK